MRKTLLLAFLICIFEPLLAQITPFLVTRGSGLNDEPTSVIRSSDNFTYQTGYYNQIASFGGTTLPFSGADDGYISWVSERGRALLCENFRPMG